MFLELQECKMRSNSVSKGGKMPFAPNLISYIQTAAADKLS